MRRGSNILMAALIVSALFFGNCLSCPQMMLALASQHSGHSCCHHPAARIECHSQSLSHFVKARVDSTRPLLASGVVPAMAPVMAPARPAVRPWRAAEVALPDILSLHSPLRV